MLAQLRSTYFHEFHHSIPLGNDYWAHLWENDSYDSFSEIFIQQEYKEYLPEESVTEVLDLGANYGYFSLWLQTQRPHDNIYSTLVEPSLRCQRSLQRLVQEKKINSRFNYLQRVVSDPREKKTKFFDRPFMAGSLFESSSDDDVYEVRPLGISQNFKDGKRGFDLIKCDLEGAEWQLLINYSEILENTKFLIMEWHSWHTGGGGFPQIKQRLFDLGFEILKSSKPIDSVGRDGQVGLFLAQKINFKN